MPINILSAFKILTENLIFAMTIGRKYAFHQINACCNAEKNDSCHKMIRDTEKKAIKMLFNKDIVKAM